MTALAKSLPAVGVVHRPAPRTVLPPEPSLADSVAATVRAAGVSPQVVAAIRSTAERITDVGQRARAASLQTDELVAQLKKADSEIASYDAIYDQEVLLKLLAAESDPPPALRQIKRIRRAKETAIAAHEYELAADLREHEREIVRAHAQHFDEDSIWRLRQNGLVKSDDDYDQVERVKLTRAGRKLAASLL